jgi:enoyl-CoA hydratase/carnithine racemase
LTVAEAGSPPVVVSRRGSMAVLTLNRPADRNPLDRELSAALLVAMDAAMADPDVRAVAIAAEGPAFCAGGDLRQLKDLRTMPAEQAYAWPADIVALHRAALVAPKPMIALVDGPAYAGGMGLAGICDVLLVTERARFAMPEIRMGLFPMIIVAHLARAMPRKLLLDLMLTGRPIDAAEAYRAGFVTRVCDGTDELWRAADEYAGWFAATSPLAARLGRRAFALLADLPAGQALDAAQFLNLTFFLGSDLAEGATAFLEKRPPAWSQTEQTSDA